MKKVTRYGFIVSRTSSIWSFGKAGVPEFSLFQRLSGPVNLPTSVSKYANLVAPSQICPPLLVTRGFTSVPTPPGESVPDTHVLSYAAEEAERLLQLSSSRSENSGSVVDNAKVALGAANSLLLVTPSDALLQDKSASQTPSLHRAFLVICSWCLDHVQQQGGALSLELQTQMLEMALGLARRAHQLSLPLHLPLYQRLMEALATVPHTSIGSRAFLIMEVSSWVASTLDAPVDPILFRSSLLHLIEARRISDALEVLNGMRLDHGIQNLDLAMLTDILLLLQTTIGNDLSTTLRGDSSLSSSFAMPSPDINMQDAVEIVEFLEGSIIELLLGEYSKSESMGEHMQVLLARLTPDQVSNLLDRLSAHPTWSDEDEGMISDLSEDEGEMERDAVDVAVQSVLTKGAVNVKPRTVLLELIGTSPPAPVAILARPRMNNSPQNVYSYQTHEEDTDESQDGWRITAAEMIYSRGHLAFPDVTAQAERLNGGQQLLFTKEFEQILWERDYEEDVALFEIMRREPGFTADTDSGDDSDDDY